MLNEDTVETHPSFAMAGFHRTQGGRTKRLFGSAICNHFTTINLTIRKCERHHHLAKDWYMGKDELIQVEFSAAQFVELLTTMNIGFGVPCTLRYTQDQGRVEDPPMDTEVEAEKIKSGFKEEMKKFAGKLKTMRAEAAEILESKGPISAVNKTIIKRTIDSMVGEVIGTIPFIMEQFYEAAEKITTGQKAEVEAFLMHAITTAGLQALQGKADEMQQHQNQLAGDVIDGQE